jgi:hypothetical protein
MQAYQLLCDNLLHKSNLRHSNVMSYRNNTVGKRRFFGYAPHPQTVTLCTPVTLKLTKTYQKIYELPPKANALN